MNAIALATKGIIAPPPRQYVVGGGGGIIYRDREKIKEIEFPKVEAQLIERLTVNEEKRQISVKAILLG